MIAFDRFVRRAGGLAFAMLYLLMAVMAAATFVEKRMGHDAVAAAVYGSWWFAVLWALSAVFGLVWLLACRRPLHVVVLHVALVVILCGAWLTSVTSTDGQIHLRVGQTARHYTVSPADGGGVRPLPAAVTLRRFEVREHPGTGAHADYVSYLRLTAENGRQQDAVISMNNVFHYGGMRFYQMSYDSDRQGSYVQVCVDRWGWPLSYAGYGLLFVALLWMLFAPRGRFFRLLRHPALRRGFLLVAGLSAVSLQAAPTLPKAEADRFGRLLVAWNGRICPMQTLARDFTTKLSGVPGYGDYTAEQVMTGWVFWGDEWAGEPLIRVRSEALSDALGVGRYAAFNDFFSPTTGYRLAPYLQDYYAGRRSGLADAAAEVDDKLQLILSLRQGKLWRIFPLADSTGNFTWYAPTDVLPAQTDTLHAGFVQLVFSEFYAAALSGDETRMTNLIEALDAFQREASGDPSWPSERSLKAERLYNALPLPVWLSRLHLTVGLLLMVVLIVKMVRRSGQPVTERQRWAQRWQRRLSVGLMAMSLVALTTYLALRMEISGRLPLGNGYETMLAISWMLVVLSLSLCRRLWIAVPAGFLLSGFFLLVSSLSQMNPQVTPLVPVLSSPWLGVHVSLVMAAYALLSFTLVCALVAGAVTWARGGVRAAGVSEQLEALAVLSRIFLFPGIALLGGGIFVGAIWAGQSWGRLWGWDPKEVWALISFLFYAVPLHDNTLRRFRRPAFFHAYMVVAFLTVVMTYWGVNYFLGGLHSYAG